MKNALNEESKMKNIKLKTLNFFNPFNLFN